jgi:REP element-mobilizing transposase RayT
MAMPNPDNLPRRHHIRLRTYDYSQAGAYFVTVCAHDRACLFGDIENGVMVSNEYGRAVMGEWLNTAAIRADIRAGECVVMPNHFHGIVIIETGTARRAPTGGCNAPAERFGQPVSGSLPTIVRAFKSAVTRRINEIRQSPGVPVWQRNYYEHVIRNEDDYRQIAEYIADNSHRWEEDTLHPDHAGTARRAPTTVP